MPPAIPAIVGAAVSYGVTTAFGVALTSSIGAFGATLVSGLAGAAASAATAKIITPTPNAPDPTAFLNTPGGGRTQQFRQPVAPQQIGFGRYKTSGPVMFIHSMADDEGRTDGYFYIQHALASHHVKAIDDIYYGDELSSEAKFVGFGRTGKNLGTAMQMEDADFLAEIGSDFEDHWGRGIANIATRLKIKPEPFPSGAPNIAAIVSGNDEIFDPR